MAAQKAGKKILIVDDESIIAMHEASVLKNYGYDVVTAYSGKKAVEAAAAEEIDLILMDIDLGSGEMDGTEAAEQILSRQQLPIVFVTSHSEQEMVEKVKGITRYGYVLKNAGEFVLIEAITMAFELFRSYLALQEKEQQLELAMDAEDHAYWDLNLDTGETYFSPRYYEMLGYEPEELPMHIDTWKELLHPEDMNDVYPRIMEKAEKAEAFEEEFRLKTKNGTWKWIKGRGKSYRLDEDGNPHRVVGTHEDITERKEAELAFLESEKKYQFLLENLDDIIYTINMETEEFSFISSAFERVLGYTLDDVEAMGGRKAFLSAVIRYGAFQEQLRALADFAGENAQRLRHISVWKAKDGSSKILEDYWVPLYKNGILRTVHGVLRDITDRKRAENALQESENKYKILVDNLPFAVFELDNRGNIITVNKTIADFLGIPPDELTGGNMETFFPPDALEVRKNYVETAIAEKTIQRFTDRENGRTFNHIIVPFSVNGEPRVQIIAQDVTEQTRLQQESEHHRLFWEGIFHSSPDAIVALDNENKIVGWNEAAEEMFGYSAEEAAGRNVDELIAGRDEETRKEAESITRLTFSGREVSRVETKRFRKDGSAVDVRITGSPVMIDGVLSGVVGMYSDITERKRAEERVRKSLEEKDFLMKELNHRVKNNLAMITALIGLKDSSLGDDVDLSDVINQIEAIRIIHEKMYETDEISSIDVQEYLHDLLDTVFSSFSPVPVQVEESIGNLHISTKKAVSLGLIINEIVTNAIKHGFSEDREAWFSVGLREDGPEGERVLTLANSGRPFPEDIDLDNPSTLGLRLISALVDQLGGSLELQRHPHPEFSIRFPAGD